MMHTPGPWTAAGVVGDIEVVAERYGICVPICGVYHPTRSHKPAGVPSEEEAWHNAALIAASPELLELLVDTTRALYAARGRERPQLDPNEDPAVARACQVIRRLRGGKW